MHRLSARSQGAVVTGTEIELPVADGALSGVDFGGHGEGVPLVSPHVCEEFAVHPSAAPAIREISVADRDAGPYGIATGPDGALWLTFAHSGRIARLTLDGELGEYPLDSSECRPAVITPGPDEALWFTRSRDHRIGRITADGETESFPVPTPDSGPFGFATGPDGAMWFTEMNTDRIGRITDGGEIAEYGLPSPSSEPHGITVGSDGALWAALETGGVARLEP